MVRLLARPPGFLAITQRCFLCLLDPFVVWVACLHQFVITIPSEWIRFFKKEKKKRKKRKKKKEERSASVCNNCAE